MANFRRRVKASTGGRCARCGSTREVEAHHVRPLAAAGSNDPANGLALCRPSHDAAHRTQRER
jgi:predicted restriction endonuclease